MVLTNNNIKKIFSIKLINIQKNLKNVIVAGDFNIVQELRDREGGNINNSHLTGLKAIKKLKNDHNLEDTWQLIYPTKT